MDPGKVDAGNVQLTGKKCQQRLESNGALIDVLLAGVQSVERAELATIKAREQFASELKKASVDEGCVELRGALDATCTQMNAIEQHRSKLLVRKCTIIRLQAIFYFIGGFGGAC